MDTEFDPYYRWLGIRPDEQPPSHYRLLAIAPFEDNPDVIEAAADQRTVHLRTYQTGRHSALTQKLLNEVAAARVCLLDPQKKAEYDRGLQEKLAAAELFVGFPAEPSPVARSLPALPRQPRQPAWRSPLAIGGFAVGLVVVFLIGYALFLSKPNRDAPGDAVQGKPKAPPPVKPPATAPVRPRKPRPATRRTITNSIGMKLVLIPAGECSMGSTRAEIERAARESKDLGLPEPHLKRPSFEGPQHRVRITRSFCLGVHEVTQGQYTEVMEVNPSHFCTGGDGGDQVLGRDTDDFPVERVSWNQAGEFCRRLSQLPAERAAGRVYRLPTEAEWEYACRAGSAARYGFGDDPAGLADHAWFAANSAARPHPVGWKKPNAWGLFDVHGNVYEWCSDWFHAKYHADAPSDDPTGPASGIYHVLRGGSFEDPALGCRCASRPYGGGPNYRKPNLGFRVVCVADAPL